MTNVTEGCNVIANVYLRNDTNPLVCAMYLSDVNNNILSIYEYFAGDKTMSGGTCTMGIQ